MFDFACKKPVRFTLVFSVAAGWVVGLVWSMIGLIPTLVEDGMTGAFSTSLPSLVLVFTLLGLLIIGPLILSLYNICYLLLPKLSAEAKKAGRWIEVTTMLYGAFCTHAYAQLTEIKWDQNWWEQLYNAEIHAPVATWTWPTLLTVAGVFLVGYLILRLRSIHRLPPLLATLAIGGLYLGAVVLIAWCVQVIQRYPLLCLWPVNLVLIVAKVIKEVILDWQEEPHEAPQGKPAVIMFLYRIMMKAKNWPWIGLLCALPLLGIVIAVLTLFGQAPDSIIQAWTQTSDWTLSQQVAPQNIYYDLHYLCTVAAGGHRKLVKPLREGKRHGHKVLVNRQLCVANAFEQVLQERLPRTHCLIRGIYDRYGYPIAKHIRSAYVADAVWLLMKPLEWLFLIVLYMVDVKPENRIAVQYPHAPLPSELDS